MPITKKNMEEISSQIHKICSDFSENRTNLKFHEKRISTIFTRYAKVRDKTKEYMSKKDAAVIDRHKVAAIIIVSLVREKLITINDEKKATQTERASNILCAYWVAQGIIKDFYKNDPKTEGIELEIYEPPTLTGTKYVTEFHNLIKNNLDLAKFVKQNIYGDKIVIGMGAGSISNWMRKLPKLL